MYCQNKIVYTVQAGDSLYKLSRQYKTTVTELILGNPGVNPYNLQVGMKLTICPGREYGQPGSAARPGQGMRPGAGMQPGEGAQPVPEMAPGEGAWPGAGMQPGQETQAGQEARPGMGMTPDRESEPGMRMRPGQGMAPGEDAWPGTGMLPESGRWPGAGMQPGGEAEPGMGTVPGPELPQSQGRPGEKKSASEVENDLENLVEGMRLAWLEHVYWMRMYLMSVTADAADQQAVEERAQQTADEITDIFARALPINVTRQLRNLLMEHVELTGEIIRTLKSEDKSDYDALIKEWYGNANQIAALLGGQNPFFGGKETRNLLLNHLDLVREEIEYQINGEYGESIETFRDVVKQALLMADYFARGLLAR